MTQMTLNELNILGIFEVIMEWCELGITGRTQDTQNYFCCIYPRPNIVMFQAANSTCQRDTADILPILHIMEWCELGITGRTQDTQNYFCCIYPRPNISFNSRFK